MTSSTNHFDEELELYALGMLEPDERDRIDEHVRACDACAERKPR
jgi:anti-sigma factor RsiW